MKRPRNHARRTGRSHPSAGALRAAAALVAAALLGATSAQAPTVEPTFAYVQEAEPIVLTLAPDVSTRWLDAIGTVTQGRLSIAFTDRLDRGIRLAFRLAGDEPATVRSLLFGDPFGAFTEVDVGELTIVPAVPTGPSPLRRRGTVRYGEGAILQAWRLENDTDVPQQIDTLTYASRNVARPAIVVRVVPSDGSLDDLTDWLERLQRALTARLPSGRRAAPPVVEDALRELLPEGALRDPTVLGLMLAPGESVDLVLTSASFAVDLSRVNVLADPLLGGSDPRHGAWQRSLSKPLRIGSQP